MVRNCIPEFRLCPWYSVSAYAAMNFVFGKALHLFRYLNCPETRSDCIWLHVGYDCLNSCAGGRGADGVVPLLKYVHKYIHDPRFTRLLLAVANRLIDIYAPVVLPPKP